jgi:hypothetical protein
MHKLLGSLALLALLASITACHETPVAAPSPAHVDPRVATVDALVGKWRGKAEGTPLGDFPIGLTFARDSDRSVHARLDDGHGMYLDFRFMPDGKLFEEGAIPSVGKQAHTLVPVAGATRWSDSDVDLDVALTGDSLVMTTTLHGKPHAVFRMQRAGSVAAQ